jgi:hypothetical protein
MFKFFKAKAEILGVSWIPLVGAHCMRPTDGIHKCLWLQCLLKILGVAGFAGRAHAMCPYQRKTLGILGLIMVTAFIP